MCLKAGVDVELPQPVGYNKQMAADAESGTFSFNIDILAFYDAPKHWIVEKGAFEFYVGKSSKEILCSDTVTVEKTHEIDHHTRCLIAQASC